MASADVGGAPGMPAQYRDRVDQARDMSDDSDDVIGSKELSVLRATRCPSPDVTNVSGPWNLSNDVALSSPPPLNEGGGVDVSELKLMEATCNLKQDIDEYAKRQATRSGEERSSSTAAVASMAGPWDVVPSASSPPSIASGAAPSLNLETIRRSAIYCTPHIKIPGILTIAQDSLLFEPDTRHEHVREFGIGEYQLFLEMPDLLEPAAMAMPFEESSLGDVAFFLQLHVRTLDGHRFCSPNVDTAWCVVFRLQSREDLHEAAKLLIDFLDISRANAKTTAGAPRRSCTSIPFCSMSCLAEFEAASEQRRRSAQRERIKDAVERPKQRPGTSPTSREGPTNWESNALSWSGALSMTEKFTSKLAGVFSGGGQPEETATSPGRNRQSIQQGTAELPSPTKAKLEADMERAFSVVLKIPEDLEIKHTLLNPALAEALLDYLPVTCRSVGVVEWVLKYTPKAHGTSINTLYRNVSGNDQTIVFVRDANNHVFGGFAPACWKECNSRFYGSGEAFVFSYGELPADAGREEQVAARVFPWTARNNYFMYSDHDLLGMGGGNGRYAFAVHSDFLRGISSPTATFGNPTLASTEEFAMRDIEVWAFEEV